MIRDVFALTKIKINFIEHSYYKLEQIIKLKTAVHDK
jgi:hypothetical protein